MMRKVSAIHRRKISSQFGLAVVEFTVVATFLFILIFTIVDLTIFGFVKLTMQHAVREGARYAVTGRSDLDPDAQNNREAAILEKIRLSSNGYLDLVMEPDDIRVEDIDGNSVAGFGSSGQLIVIHLDCEWPTTSLYLYPILDEGNYVFTVSAAMKNEAF
ncbi:pilus assembly protein [Vibrio vulnificus]|uniref:TadE/TadG family type IV pilus assembly protein n=1 Tax=Vibrio vulnificus TaxID=672 RepID=UPI001D82DA88|nr:TadE/TadG family type IV pilus assembly protein [Vibrio vulnificus]EGR0669019.1 pilus assembly protein [Vibrio vulnificus]EGR1510334.1 pilus assembly protein [Vibrio vulnificus]EHT4940394.1 pilus assembly protein [Vibrio vulnificus]EJV0367430.1 pilus assembly protein [Vibrio vulnificus]EMB7842847.1 pilus assembly protein [Vibrio vulnificus]